MKKLPLKMSGVRRVRVRTWSSDSGCDPGNVISVEEEGDVTRLVDEAVSVWIAMMERHLQLLSHQTKESLFTESQGKSFLSHPGPRTILISYTLDKSDVMGQCKKGVAMMLSELPQLVQEVNQEVERLTEAYIDQMADEDSLEEVSEDLAEYGVRKRKAEEAVVSSPKLRKWCHSCEVTNDDISEDEFDALLNDWDWSSEEWDVKEEEIYSHILKSFHKAQTMADSSQKLSKLFYEDNEADTAYNDFNFWKLDHYSPDLSLNIDIADCDLIAVDNPSAQDLLQTVSQESQDWTKWSFWSEFGSSKDILEVNEELILSDWANWKFWNYFGTADEILAANEEVLSSDWTQWKFWNFIGPASSIVRANEELLPKSISHKKPKIKQKMPTQYFHQKPRKLEKKSQTLIYTRQSMKKRFVRLYPKQPRK